MVDDADVKIDDRDKLGKKDNIYKTDKTEKEKPLKSRKKTKKSI